MGFTKPGKLSPLQVASLKERGYFGDGGGLYLRVTEGGTKSWAFRYVRGRLREVGLGPLFDVPLADARDKARDLRKALRDGIDPLEAKKKAAAARAVADAKSVTFEWCAEQYIAAHRAGWRNPKHASQWENTLAKYASPVIGALPVQAVDTALVLKILQPIWQAKSETASRVRGRIESILDWAAVSGHRTGDNPARWDGHLVHKLARRVATVEHLAALPFDQINAFVTDLRKQEGIAARALEFLILTAARTGEVIGAEWKEFDLHKAVWSVPAERMKAKKPHTVPLPTRAVEILKELLQENGGQFVFHGGKPGKSLSTGAMLMLLRRMGRTDATPHGFRSTFRDWASERSTFPREVCEMALAHNVGNAVEQAYRRGDLFDKRRKLMEAWQAYIEKEQKQASATNVIPMKKSAK